MQQGTKASNVTYSIIYIVFFVELFCEIDRNINRIASPPPAPSQNLLSSTADCPQFIFIKLHSQTALEVRAGGHTSRRRGAIFRRGHGGHLLREAKDALQ